MEVIAIGLENHNPFAYLLIFLILYPPVMVILFAIIDKIKVILFAIIDKIKRR